MNLPIYASLSSIQGSTCNILILLVNFFFWIQRGRAAEQKSQEPLPLGFQIKKRSYAAIDSMGIKVCCI